MALKLPFFYLPAIESFERIMRIRIWFEGL